MAERDLIAELIAGSKRPPEPEAESSAWWDALAGATGSIAAAKRKLRGKQKKAEDDRAVQVGIRG